MPGTQQCAQPDDKGEKRPRPIPEWHSTISHDHQGRRSQSIWKGYDSAKRPRFSWQVYSTATNLNDDYMGIATFLGGLEIAEYEATFDIYAPLPDTYACIAHQKLERQHRKDRSSLIDQSSADSIIPECYGSRLHLGGFIIVIDNPDWKSEDRGLLFASFDIRPADLTVVEPDLNAEDAGIFEQIELTLTRQRQPRNLDLELKAMWIQSGGYDWELCSAEALEKLSASPEVRSAHDYSSHTLLTEDNFFLQSSDHDPGLRQVQITYKAAEETATNMTYSIYTTSPNTQTSGLSLEETARSFTATIVSYLPHPKQSISFQFFGPLPDIGSCISHHHSHAPSITTGYLDPLGAKRRFPQHGIGAAGAAYVGEPDYRTFLVVLDKANDEEGVLFVWDDLRPQPEDLLLQLNDEALVGRLPGLKTVAERLAGLL